MGSDDASAVALGLVGRAFNAAHGSNRPTGPALCRTHEDIREGSRVLWSHPLTRPLARARALRGFGNSLTGGAATALLAVYAVGGPGLPEGDARLGLLVTAGAVAAGAVVGWCSSLRRPAPPATTTWAQAGR